MGPEGETWFENVKQEADLWEKSVLISKHIKLNMEDSVLIDVWSEFLS